LPRRGGRGLDEFEPAQVAAGKQRAQARQVLVAGDDQEQRARSHAAQQPGQAHAQRHQAKAADAAGRQANDADIGRRIDAEQGAFGDHRARRCVRARQPGVQRLLRRHRARTHHKDLHGLRVDGGRLRHARLTCARTPA
jgi:hypothetical protein